MAEEKTSLHPRNKHRSRYDFPALIDSQPELKAFVSINPYGDLSIDFSNPSAVKALNKALLRYFYKINHWDIPENYLCPPIPGRADYVHYLADLLGASNGQVIPTGKSIKGLDIGVGANCVYPIIGHQEYGWSFIGSEVDDTAIKACKAIIESNPELLNAVVCRKQENKQYILRGILKPGEFFDFVMCNPPFHASAQEAMEGSQRKTRNLGKQKGKIAVLNFGGQSSELWYQGGELGFIRRMIEESIANAKQCLWFTSLVSKSMNLQPIYASLKWAGVAEIKTIEMAQGQKISRIVAWTFLDVEQQQEWAVKRFQAKAAKK